MESSGMFSWGLLEGISGECKKSWAPADVENLEFSFKYELFLRSWLLKFVHFETVHGHKVT